MSPSTERRRPPQKLKGQGKRPRRLDGEVLDVHSCAALIGGTEKQTYARVKRQQLPFRRWSGRVIFLRSEVLAFLSKLNGVGVDQALRNVAARKGSALA